MKFGQLIEHNMRDIFLEKSFAKCGGDAISRPYFWINSLKFYTAFFIACQVEDYKNILQLSCRPLVFTSYKAF